MNGGSRVSIFVEEIKAWGIQSSKFIRRVQENFSNSAQMKNTVEASCDDVKSGV